MASLVQSAIGSSTSASSVSCSWPSTTTSNNLLVMALMAAGGSGTTAVVSSDWTLAGSIDNGTNVKTAVYYIAGSAPRSGSESVSFTGTIDGATLAIGEWSLTGTGVTVDTSSTGTGSGTVSATGSVTTSTAVEVLVGATGYGVSVQALTQSTPSGSFTLEQSAAAGSGFTNYSGVLLDLVTSSSGTYSTGTTCNKSVPWAAVLIAFKISGNVTVSVSGQAAAAAIGSVIGTASYAASGQALAAALGIAASVVESIASGQDLRLYTGIALGPNDAAVDVSSQEVSAAIGDTLSFPSASVSGQLLTVGINSPTHLPDVNRIVSGLSCSVAAGTASSAVTGVVAGENLNVNQGVARTGNDVAVSVTGLELHTTIECYKNTVADTGPNEKTYTIFDSGGSHDIAPNVYPDYNSVDLIFPLPMGMMASASDHAVLNTESLGTGYKYYADGHSVGDPAGVAQFQTVPHAGNPALGVPYTYTLDFDGLNEGNHGGVVKSFPAGGLVPQGVFTWDGHWIRNYPGPYFAPLGPGYANFSDLVYTNQGGNLTCTQIIDGFYQTTRLYCAYIQIVVTSNSQPAVLLQADTFDGALNVLWVSGGPPGALKHAVHLSPSLQIGTSTVGWETTQTIESGTSTSSCGIVYLPEGRIYIDYGFAGQNYQRYNDQRGTGDVSAWSTRAAANSNRISAGGRGQEQSWRFLAGASSKADSIYFSQCRDGAGQGWTDQTTTIKAVNGTAKGPLCGGVFTGNEYGLLYTRHSDGKVFYLTTGDPTTWSGAGTDTTFTGNVCGLARHPSGRLVGLVQSSAGGAVKAIYSDDRGANWTDVALSITPTPPPVIVCDSHYLYAVYIESDSPKFACSSDGGLTWT